MVESREQFINEIKKVNAHREHKITNSLGVYDAYKYIRKNKWFNIPRPLKEGEFYKIIRTINNYLAEEFIKGKEIILPYKLGAIEIRKAPTYIAIKEGKLCTNLPIDWDSTLKLWYEDEEAFNNKTLIRHEQEGLFKVYYNKKYAIFNNKAFFDFRPTRYIKRSLTKSAREGNLDAFLFNRNYD